MIGRRKGEERGTELVDDVGSKGKRVNVRNMVLRKGWCMSKKSRRPSGGDCAV